MAPGEQADPGSIADWPQEPAARAVLAAGGGGRRRVIAGAVAVAVAIAVSAYEVAAGIGAARPDRLERTTLVDRFAEIGSSLAFSPNGMLLAVSGVFSETVVYNLATGRQVAVLPACCSANLTSNVFSPDGRTLVVTSDGTVNTQLWDTATWKRELPLPQPRYVGYYSASYNPAGTLLAASDDAGTSTYLWSIARRRVTASLSYPNAEVSPIAFSPAGQMLAVGDGWQGSGQGRGYGNIHLWDVTTRKTVATLHDPGGLGIFSFGYSPDGRLLAVTDALHVFVWNARTRKLLATITPPGHAVLRCLEFSPAGQTLAVTGNDARTYVWSVATRKLAAVLTDPLGAAVSSLAYSPDGRTLAISDQWGHIYLWDVSGLS